MLASETEKYGRLLTKGQDGRYADRIHDFLQEAGKGDAVKHFMKIFKR